MTEEKAEKTANNIFLGITVGLLGWFMVVEPYLDKKAREEWRD